MPATSSRSGAFSALDDLSHQAAFTQAAGAYRESRLAIEGMRCAVCAHSIEHTLRSVAGVISAEVNIATQRANVVWDHTRMRISTVFDAIHGLGYQPFPVRHAALEAARQAERRRALWRLFVAGFCMMQVMMYAAPAYFAQPGEISPDIDRLLKWASWILTLPVMAFSAGPFFSSAWRDLRARRIGMDVPVALGIAVTFVASSWALKGQGEVYFDSLTMFVFFLLGGRYLEAVAREKATLGLEDLSRALPQTVLRLTQYPDLAAQETVSLHQLHAGDVVRVPVGETVPGDGLVLDGQSAADEAILTGESRPVDKRPGDTVVAGSHNLSGPLVVRLERLGRDSRFGQIADLMERAAALKPPLAALADRYASRFLGIVLLLAAAAGLAWLAIDPSRAAWVVASVLIVTCPCALSLATPAAMVAATGRLAKQGMLVCNPAAMERLGRCDKIIFDKTGTLTTSAMQCVGTDMLRHGWTASQTLRVAVALENGSLHPIARALRQGVEHSTECASATNVQETPGGGVAGDVDGRRYRLGSLRFAAPGLALSSDGAMALLSDDEGPIARFRFDQPLQAHARAAMDRLRAAQLSTMILSGDAQPCVARIAAALQVDEAQAEASPEAKLATVAALQAQGHVVLMVGDGVNDAPVMARADVSIAIGQGASLARAHADMVLLSNRLEAIPDAIALARKTQHAIRQNLTWALSYNLLSIPAAMLGYLPPWLAGLGMACSSLAVIANALRLSR